jgi:hypothetical protein
MVKLEEFGKCKCGDASGEKKSLASRSSVASCMVRILKQKEKAKRLSGALHENIVFYVCNYLL